MGSKFASFIMSILIALIIAILGVFGILIYQEVTGNDAVEQVENFVSSYQTIFDDMQDKNEIKTSVIVSDKVNEISSTPGLTLNTSTNYNQVQINKYFYEQLEEESKIIYKALEANKEGMKTGTTQIELGTVFSELLAKEDGEKKLGEYYQSAVESYLYDNPDVFYITANKLYLNIETTTRINKKTYNVFINSGKSPNYFSDDYTSEAQVKQAISQIEQIKERILSQRIGKEYYDIKMVHDYLINEVEYERTISKDNIYNLYGALVNKECVCEGYAKAFKYLLDEMNIPCIMVIGTGTNSKGETENHAWNYVQIEGNWYAVDCTWDDPVIIGSGKVGNDIKYRYFLKGQSTMNKDHTPDGHFTDDGREYTYPRLSLYDY